MSATPHMTINKHKENDDDRQKFKTYTKHFITNSKFIGQEDPQNLHCILKRTIGTSIFLWIKNVMCGFCSNPDMNDKVSAKRRIRVKFKKGKKRTSCERERKA